MRNEGYTLQDVTSLLRRRWKLMGAVCLAFVLTSAVVAWSLENVYQAGSLIAIECPEVPDPVIQSSCGEIDRAQRIQRIEDEVMTKENLASIVERYDLYREERAGGPPESGVGYLRSNVVIAPVYSEQDPRSKSLGEVVGFQLDFYGSEPETTRDVARDLTALFIEAGARRRQVALGEASGAMEREANRMRVQLREAEAALADFKQRNPGAMPEDRQFNRQQLDRKQSELEGLNSQIRDLENRQALVQSQLSQTQPYVSALGTDGEPVPGAADRLRVLQSELIRLLAVYSPDHPDVVRVRREMDSLAGSLPGISMRQALEAELAAKRTELEAAKSKYGDEHPDVQTLTRAVQNLTEQIANAPDTPPVQAPNNPVYLQMQVQVQGYTSEVNALRAQRNNLMAQIQQLESRVAVAPEVERELLELTRDYSIAKQSYDDARSKQLAAQRSGTLAAEQLTENYEVQRPATLPYTPTFPKRSLFVIVGLFLGLTFGTGAALGAEAIDSTVRGTRDVRTLLDAPPMAAVPFIATATDRRRLRLKRFVTATAVTCVVVAVGLYVQLQRTGAI